MSRKQDDSLILFSIITGGDPCGFLKHPVKVLHCVEPGAEPYLLDNDPGIGQEIFRSFHPVVIQVRDQGIPGIFCKQGAQVSAADA